MKVIVNGQDMTLVGQHPHNVRQLLEQHGLGAAPCAVEINRKIVPKRRHEEHLLAEGDHVEIVTLVGGG